MLRSSLASCFRLYRYGVFFFVNIWLRDVGMVLTVQTGLESAVVILYGRFDLHTVYFPPHKLV